MLYSYLHILYIFTILYPGARDLHSPAPNKIFPKISPALMTINRFDKLAKKVYL